MDTFLVNILMKYNIFTDKLHGEFSQSKYTEIKKQHNILLPSKNNHYLDI